MLLIVICYSGRCRPGCYPTTFFFIFQAAVARAALRRLALLRHAREAGHAEPDLKVERGGEEEEHEQPDQAPLHLGAEGGKPLRRREKKDRANVGGVRGQIPDQLRSHGPLGLRHAERGLRRRSYTIRI